MRPEFDNSRRFRDDPAAGGLSNKVRPSSASSGGAMCCASVPRTSRSRASCSSSLRRSSRRLVEARPPSAAWSWFLSSDICLLLIFAWAFEITHDGLKRESEVDRSQSTPHRPARSSIACSWACSRSHSAASPSTSSSWYAARARGDRGHACRRAHRVADRTPTGTSRSRCCPFVNIQRGQGPGIFLRRDLRGAAELAGKDPEAARDLALLGVLATRARTLARCLASHAAATAARSLRYLNRNGNVSPRTSA